MTQLNPTELLDLHCKPQPENCATVSNFGCYIKITPRHKAQPTRFSSKMFQKCKIKNFTIRH